MLNIKVAVVMPVGKIDSYLIDCYESILNQTLKPNKIVLVFDTPRNFLFDNLVLHSNVIFVSTLKKGQANARNIGIRLVQDCDFIATMDADDLMLQNRIEFSVQKLVNNPGMDVYCFASDYIDKEGQAINFHLNNDSVLQGHEFIRSFYERNIIINSTSFIRTSAIFDAGLYSNLSKMVDYDLWLRFILLDKRFIFIPEVLIKSRIHEFQISHARVYKREILRVLRLRIKVGQKIRLSPLILFVNNLVWFMGKILNALGFRKSRLKRVLTDIRNR